MVAVCWMLNDDYRVAFKITVKVIILYVCIIYTPFCEVDFWMKMLTVSDKIIKEAVRVKLAVRIFIDNS